MASIELFQQAVDRGVSDRLPERLRPAFEDAVRRGLVRVPEQPEAQATQNTLPVSSDQQGQAPSVGKDILAKIDRAILDAPMGAQVAEIAAGFNRGIAGMIDTLGIEPVNAILQLSGSEFKIPNLSSRPAFVGGFVDDGLQRDILRGAGEASSMALGVTQLAKGAAQLAKPNGIGQKVLQQIGAMAPVADASLGAASGAGAAVGKELGGTGGSIAGALLAPVAAISLKSILSSGASGIKSLISSTSGLSDDAASKMLAEKMQRENLSPSDVESILKNLGDEGMPADLGAEFNSLLRAAANQFPRIQGRAIDVLKKRQAGQGSRLVSAFDDAAGTSSLTVDDEILRINKEFSPEITKLYNAARAKDFEFSPSLKNIMDKSPSLVKASKKALIRIEDKAALGEKITSLTKIDEIKRVLDDDIGKFMRSGETNRAMDLIKLKNVIVSEADAAVPEYAQARSLFAGKKELENAADLGTQFLKMKPREVTEATKTMLGSEKRLFKLGAKQAIIDKVDNIHKNSDAVRLMFSKDGDLNRLKPLFDSDKEFKKFSEILEREAKFIITRRAALENSSTAKQLADLMRETGGAEDALSTALQATQSPVAAAGVFGRIMSGLRSKKTDASRLQALEQAGDILLNSGMDARKLANMLRRGIASEIEKALTPVLVKPSPSIPSLKATVINEQRENK